MGNGVIDMPLLALWIILLVSFFLNKHCKLGKTIDWYEYTKDKRFISEASMIFQPKVKARKQQIHWFLEEGGDQIIFWYNPENMPHGVCARMLPTWLHLRVDKR